MIHEQIQEILALYQDTYRIQMGSLLKESINKQDIQSSEDFIWIVYLAALRYKFFNNTHAYHYCLLEIKDCKNVEIPNKIAKHLEDLYFIEIAKKRLYKQIFVVACILGILLGGMLLYFNVVWYVSILVGILLATVNGLVVGLKLKNAYEENLYIKLKSYVDDTGLIEYINKYKESKQVRQ